jgi:hypothetical protein
VRLHTRLRHHGLADVAAARAFIAFLQTPQARGVILEKGMGVSGR